MKQEEYDVALAIAKAHFSFLAEETEHDGEPEEWNERLHFKVPIIMYLAMARAALEATSESLPDEVESVARAMWHDEAMRYADIPLEDWRKVEGHERDDWLRQARAAIKGMYESRKELEDQNDGLIGYFNDLLQWLARQGFEVSPELSPLRNVRKAIKSLQEKKND